MQNELLNSNIDEMSDEDDLSSSEFNDNLNLLLNYNDLLTLGPTKIIEKSIGDKIQKIITLPNNRIASCSRDNKIKIWKATPPYNSTPIKVLEGHINCIMSILYVKEKDLLVSALSDKTLRLWSISTYQCISIITDISICWINALYQIDGERVIVGANDGLFIVNIVGAVLSILIIVVETSE